MMELVNVRRDVETAPASDAPAEAEKTSRERTYAMRNRPNVSEHALILSLAGDDGEAVDPARVAEIATQTGFSRSIIRRVLAGEVEPFEPEVRAEDEEVARQMLMDGSTMADVATACHTPRVAVDRFVRRCRDAGLELPAVIVRDAAHAAALADAEARRQERREAVEKARKDAKAARLTKRAAARVENEVTLREGYYALSDSEAHEAFEALKAVGPVLPAGYSGPTPRLYEFADYSTLVSLACRFYSHPGNVRYAVKLLELSEEVNGM